MASESQEKAALVQAPIAAADTNGVTGVHRIAITGSTQFAAIPAKLRGKWVDLYCTADVQYAFSSGTSSQTIALNQAAALGTGNAAAGKTLVAGMDKPTRVPLTATFINFIGTTGYLEIVCSEGVGL